MQNIRTITLDLDDTLWAIAPVILRAEACLYEWFEQHYPRINQLHSSQSISKLRDRVVAEHQNQAHDLTFLRRAVIARLGEASGYFNFPVDEAFAVFDTARNELELFPDVLPALSSLQERYTLVAVTNGNANLDKIGIGELFDGFVSARSVGAAKPAPEIFAAAVTVGGATCVQTLHVGDHPETDVAGAHNAGLKTVWVNRNGAEWPDELTKPDGIVSDLEQLDRLLLRC